jgi:CheY-like chemotaxis protein
LASVSLASALWCRAEKQSRSRWGMEGVMVRAKDRQTTILVVDDEPFVCDSIRMLLSFDGWTVLTAQNARDAQQLFDSNDVNVLITDYAMPDMTGSELAIQLRRRVPHLRTVLVTAYAEMLSSWGADLSAVDSVVSKPFRLQDLRQALSGISP